MSTGNEEPATSGGEGRTPIRPDLPMSGRPRQGGAKMRSWL